MIEVRDPKQYGEVPIRDHPSMPPTGFQLLVQPWCMAKTDQKSVYVRPVTLEVLGEFLLDAEKFHGKDARQIWQLYQDSVANWNAAKIGLVAPTGEDVAKVRNATVKPIR
jgi:hypothetical protein